MPKALEHYVAVTEYKKQEKGEITLKVGMLVEVVEKTETGKMCQGSELLKRVLTENFSSSNRLWTMKIGSSQRKFQPSRVSFYVNLN